MADKFTFTHLDKIFFPEVKVTKGGMIDYYRQVSKYMLPYLKDRPMSLLRHPNGVNGPSFFQKDFEKPPAWAKIKKIYSESTEEDVHYLVCADLDHLLYMVQLGCIEINPWNSTIHHLSKPDWMVMDLDPEDIGFDKVIEAAKVVHDVCDELNIPTYPKTSGKTGIHIFIPLSAKYTYDQTKIFGEILANLIHERTPDFTSVLRLPKKRKGKVYIDFLQNREGQTLAAPYSLRPTPMANVSTPLRWDEVNNQLKPENYTIKNILKRVDKVGDFWEPVLGKGIDIKKILSQIS